MNQEPFFEPGYTPPTAFYFGVKFDGSPDLDSSFQGISGLKLTSGTEQVGEGGNNIYRYEPPTYSDLVLKRCLVSNSALNKWCTDAIEQFLFAPKNLEISLLGINGVLASWSAEDAFPISWELASLNSASNELAIWIVEDAYPISWELASLNSASNELAIETLELKYRSFKRIIL